MSTKSIRRITLFKIPRPADQQALLDIYRKMPETAKKDGKPYILSVHAGFVFEDQRAQGYTIAVISIFRSKEDMIYYDEECEAHKELKAVAKTLHQGVMMVYFASIFDD